MLGLFTEGEGGKKSYRAYPVQAVLDAGGLGNDRAGETALAIIVDPGMTPRSGHEL